MRKICFCFLMILLSGCSLLPVNIVGDVPEETRIKAIKPEKHTKEDVVRLLGSPANITLFEEESWIWVQSKEQMRAILPPKEIERNVLVITFKPNESVKRVSQLTLKDSIEVAYDTDETPSHGKDLSIFDEMLGNFGRFAAPKERH